MLVVSIILPILHQQIKKHFLKAKSPFLIKAPYDTLMYMKLIYTDHLKSRLKQRKIPTNVVKKIFEDADEFYWDTLRNHLIVINTVPYKGKPRKVLAAYDTIDDAYEVITIHPITDTQIRQRVISGRWRYEKNKD